MVANGIDEGRIGGYLAHPFKLSCVFLILQVLLPLIILLFFVSCASSSYLGAVVLAEKPLSPYQSVLVSVNGDTNIASDVIIELESAILSVLRYQGHFTEVSIPSAAENLNADLLLKVTIKKYRRKRTLSAWALVPIVNFFKMTNKQEVDVYVELIDNKSSIKVFELKVNTKFVSQAVIIITDYLEKNK